MMKFIGTTITYTGSGNNDSGRPCTGEQSTSQGNSQIHHHVYQCSPYTHHEKNVQTHPRAALYLQRPSHQPRSKIEL